MRQDSVDVGGGPIGPELEQTIQAARGGGQPLGREVRQSMENAFGADFTDVKVHADARSDTLNRSLQSRAFTTGNDIFFRKGEFNAQNASGRELLAHELTHVVQQEGAPNSVQRKIGFELESNDWSVWRLNRPTTGAENLAGEISQPNVADEDKIPLNKTDVLHGGAGFELQADESGDGSDIEFVTSAFAEDDVGGLTTAMDDIIQMRDDIVAQMLNHVANNRYIWGQRNLNLNPQAINQPILLYGLAAPKLKMQTTAGIDLEEIANVMEAIGRPPAAEAGPLAARRAEGRNVVQSQYTAGGIMGEAPGLAQQGINAFIAQHQASTTPHIRNGIHSIQANSASLKSILALMNMYITMAGTLQQLSYPKAIAPLMSRTKFPRLFDMLAPPVRFMFAMNGGALWRQIVGSSVDAQFQDLSQPLFRVTQFGGEDMLQDITRQGWIDGIPRGVDLLTIDDYKDWQDQKLAQWKKAHPVRSALGGRSQGQETEKRKGHAEWLESFGSYGRKTEQVGRGTGTPAALFELRGMWKEGAFQGKMTAEEAKDTALKMQKYMKRINRHKDKYFGEA